MKTSELLRGIAQKIEEQGLFRSGKSNGNGTCVMISAPTVAGVPPSDDSTRKLARQIMTALNLPEVPNEPYTLEYGSVVAWNGSQPDGETVIAALRQAADRAEQEEGGQG